MTTKPKTLLETSALQVEVEIPIKAPRDKVWKALIEDIGQWWHKDFYATQNHQRFVIEPKLGGRMYEDCGNETGLIWATVYGIDPPNSLYLAGHFRPPWGGPATTLYVITLERTEDNQTILRLSDAVFGRVTENTADELDSGWRTLFEGLRDFVEKSS